MTNDQILIETLRAQITNAVQRPDITIEELTLALKALNPPPRETSDECFFLPELDSILSL